MRDKTRNHHTLEKADLSQRLGYGELHRLRDIHLVYQLPGFVEALNSTVTAHVVAQKMRSLILRSLREPWGTQLLVVLGLASARENAR